MDMYKKKEYFVRTSLKSMLFDVDSNILDAYYKHQSEEDIEFINVRNGEDKVVAGLEVLLNICVNALHKVTQGMDMRTKNLVINCFIANLVNAMADTGERGTFYDYGNGKK